jgi:hypothetical protein
MDHILCCPTQLFSSTCPAPQPITRLFFLIMNPPKKNVTICVTAFPFSVKPYPSAHGEFILTINPSISGLQSHHFFYHEAHEVNEGMADFIWGQAFSYGVRPCIIAFLTLKRTGFLIKTQ